MNLTRRLLSVFFLASVLIACAPKDGDPGPAGPEGEQGETGTANVIYSEWIESQYPDNITSVGSSFSVDARHVTEEIIDKGLVLGFAKNTPLSGAPIIYQLPIILNSNQYLVRVVKTGEVTFSVGNINSNPVGTTPFKEYRYIIIPGGIPASSARISADFSTMSFDEITDYFNIPK